MTSVVYQESSNNYTSVDQKIKGSQIVSVKRFLTPAPDTSGDFPGQIALCTVSAGKTKAFIADGKTWSPLGESDTGLPDYVVREDTDNNFTKYSQTIMGAQIPCITYGTTIPTPVSIKGDGHIYIDTHTANNHTAYVAINKQWHVISPPVDHLVMNNQPNNFTNIYQTVKDMPLVTAKTFKTKEPSSPPDYRGQLGICDDAYSPAVYIAYRNNHEGLEWEKINTSRIDVPPSIVLNDKANNFTVPGQTLSGKQILSYIDGGEQTPEGRGVLPDHEGQFFISAKYNAGKGSSNVWIARGSRWLPLNESGEDSQFVPKTNKINTFIPDQRVGNASHFSNLSTIQIGEKTPTGNITSVSTGELYLYKHTVDSKITFDLYFSLQGGTNNKWVDLKNMNNFHDVAFLNTVNYFSSDQRIGTKDHNVSLSGASQGGGNPLGVVIPISAGEIYIQKIRDSVDYSVYVATEAGKSSTWKKVFDTTNTVTGVTEMIKIMEGDIQDNHNTLSLIKTDLGTLDSDIDHIGVTVDHFGTTLEATENKVNLLDTYVSGKDANSLTSRVVELTKTCGTMDSYFKNYRSGAAAPTTSLTVGHVGEMYVQDFGSHQEAWVGVKPNSKFWVNINKAAPKIETTLDYDEEFKLLKEKVLFLEEKLNLLIKNKEA